MQRDETAKIFVGGISWNTDADMLKNHFSKFGLVADSVVMKNQQTGKSRGFGFVTFSDPSTVEVVLAQKIHNIDGRNVDAKACNSKAAAMNKHTARTTGLAKTNKIFLGGIPNEVNEELLKSIFSRYGLVKEVVIMMDSQKQRSRGFGFLTFDTEESVDEVCKDHYVEVNGKNVECKRAERRTGGGGGGGGGGAPAGGGAGLGLPGFFQAAVSGMPMGGGRGAQNGAASNVGFGQGLFGQPDWGSGQWNQNGPPMGMNQGSSQGFNQQGGGGGGYQQGWGPQAGQGPSQQQQGPANPPNYNYNYQQQGPSQGGDPYGQSNTSYGAPPNQGGGPARGSGTGSSGAGFNYGYGDQSYGRPSGPGNQANFGSSDSQQGYGGGGGGQYGQSRGGSAGGSGYHPYRR